MFKRLKDNVHGYFNNTLYILIYQFITQIKRARIKLKFFVKYLLQSSTSRKSLLNALNGCTLITDLRLSGVWDVLNQNNNALRYGLV